MSNLLQVNQLTVRFPSPAGWVTAVNQVSFQIKRGETLGLVGESGCGKSVSALSLLKLLPKTAQISGEVILQHGENTQSLLQLPDENLRRIRGKKIAMIFQEPMSSLNPLFTVGDQIAEVLRVHEGLSRKAAFSRATELLQIVGIPAPHLRVNDYPYQMSGGMRQRVMIAMALSCQPELLIADEPTTALDVTIQAQILELLQSLQAKFGMALLFISHDLAVISHLTHQLKVMYAGKIVEEGKTQDVLQNPQHPYTLGLLRAQQVSKTVHRARLATIPGVVPSLNNLPIGCSFQDRCERVQMKCREHPVPDDPCHFGKIVRCYFPGAKP